MRASLPVPVFLMATLWGSLSPVPLLAQDDAGRRSAPASADYLIGVEDVLSVSVWKEAELSKNVNVRPDGKITVPLVGDLQASGKTPGQLSAAIAEGLARYVNEPLVTVTVEQINSFKIYLIGEVGKQGELALKRRMRLLQAIAMAGGLSPYASKKIVVAREEGGREVRTEIDYRKLVSGERSELNIELKPGDTIIVP
ncbi:MAG TPA: polysaccharide biosynthesis/export family protein [Candidatus Polarisedimenticolaceae bacterium]|nr:polysaccharide biosynthesis/export family protein [Candidatus Polarisedimenticolaceae bacterium]